MARASFRGLLRLAHRYRWPLQIVVLLGLAVFAISRIDLNALADSFAHANYIWLTVAFSVYFVSRVVHAIEWQITLTKVGRAPFLGLFGATLVGTLVNAVVPASAGDFVKIQLVANRYGLPRAGLVAGRGAEALINAVVMVMFIMIALTLPQVGFVSTGLFWFAAPVAALLFLGTMLLSHKIPREMPPWRLLTRLPRRLRAGIERNWPRFREGFEVMRQPRLLGVDVLLNLFGWAVDMIIFWAYGQAFHLDVPFGAYLAVTVVIALITIFPITFGNVGTYEVVLLSALALYSVSAEEALAFAVGTHLISTTFNIGLGLAALLFMGVPLADVIRLRGPAAQLGAPEPLLVSEPRDPAGPNLR